MFMMCATAGGARATVVREGWWVARKAGGATEATKHAQILTPATHTQQHSQI